MSVTRGDFLKKLGRSLPGMILGSGVAAAAHKVLGKVAAVSNAMEGPNPTPTKLSTAGHSAEVEFIKSGPAEGNRIALTYDDGPTPGVTDRILDELERHKARATFFMIGERILAAPDLARRVLAEGHEIGNHTFTHPNLTTVPETQADLEIQRTQDIIAEILKVGAVWFRPPYGALRQNQTHMLAARELRVVLWNVDPSDWSQPGVEKITGNVLADTKPGSIILCHDKYQQTVDATKVILSALSERGFDFVTLSKLLS